MRLADELYLRAAKLRAYIEEEARRAMADLDYQKVCPFQATCALPLLGIDDGGGTEAQWIRGAAQALLPRGVTYRIDEDVQGRASLVILSFDGVTL